VKSERTAGLWCIDIGIALISLSTLVYIFVIPSILLKIVAILAMVVAFGWYAYHHFFKNQTDVPVYQEVREIILIDEFGERIKGWDIVGETSMLIGKNTRHNKVDIDLSGSDYASLISSQHAVLNCVNGEWYVEDADSSNGTGIRSAAQNKSNKIEIGRPYQIGPGDVLYIANTRLLVN